MSKIADLFHNKWLSVKEKTMENGSKYVYSSSPWCGSEGVSVLPFRKDDNKIEFLGRFELCPAHSNDIELGAIQGGMDKDGETPVFTVKRELIEEAGYDAPVECFHYLGTVRPSKSSDGTTHLFGINLDDSRIKEVTATGDGSMIEENGYCGWITHRQLANAKDPLLQSMYLRLIEKGII